MSGGADGKAEAEISGGSRFSAVIGNCQLGQERNTPSAACRIGPFRICYFGFGLTTGSAFAVIPAGFFVDK